MEERPDPRPRLIARDGGAVVAGQRCTACGYAVALPRPRCPRCRGELEPAEFGPGGAVWSSTVVHLPVAGMEPPYGLAYVDLDEEGPRILVHAADASAPLPVGAQVTLGGPDERGNPTAEVSA